MFSTPKHGHYLGPAHRFASADGSVSAGNMDEKEDKVKAEVNEAS